MEDTPTITRMDEPLPDARTFWQKLARVLASVPFAEQIAAAWYCAVDLETPHYVRGVLIGALAYFVLPTDAIPDFIVGFGFTDDASVLTMALAAVGGHIRERHYEAARAKLKALKTIGQKRAADGGIIIDA